MTRSSRTGLVLRPAMRRSKTSPPPLKPPGSRKGLVFPADPFEAIDLMKSGKDPAHVAMRRLVKKMEKAGITHAILGGLAVYAHGHRRLTVDVDILLTKEGFEEFKCRIVPKDYDPVPSRAHRFVDRRNGVTIDVLVTGRFPGSG